MLVRERLCKWIPYRSNGKIKQTAYSSQSPWVQNLNFIYQICYQSYLYSGNERIKRYAVKLVFYNYKLLSKAAYNSIHLYSWRSGCHQSQTFPGTDDDLRPATGTCSQPTHCVLASQPLC